MKKLKLSLHGVKDVLTKEQMKQVKGGIGYGNGCGVGCYTDYDCSLFSGCRLCHGYNATTNTNYCVNY